MVGKVLKNCQRCSQQKVSSLFIFSKDFLIKEKGGRVVIGKFTKVLDEVYCVIRETGCDLPLRFAESWLKIPE